MTHILLPIVEGHSEVRGVPILLRRLFLYLGRPEAQVTRPFRVQRDRILLSGEIERAIIRGLQTQSGITGILVLLDADDDDPERIETSLLEQGIAARHLRDSRWRQRSRRSRRDPWREGTAEPQYGR